MLKFSILLGFFIIAILVYLKIKDGSGSKNEVVRSYRNLVFFQDIDNYIGIDLHNYSEDGAYSGSHFILFWKLNAKKGRLDFGRSQNIVFKARYIPLIDKICVPTRKGIFLINPATAQIEKNIANESHLFDGSACFTESDLIISGLACKTSGDKDILSIVNLSDITYNFDATVKSRRVTNVDEIFS